MTTPTPADAIRAAIGALRHATDEEIAATVLRVAAAELLPRPAIDDRSPQADRDRLLHLQFLEPANSLAGNPAPAASQEALAEAREESQDHSQLSDGYHTFAELYEHRHALLLALMRSESERCWFSRYHSDGALPFGSSDWFIAGAELPTGLITYHLPIQLWGLAKSTGANELPVGMAWDGHTPADVIDRLKDWAAWYPPSREESQAAAPLTAETIEAGPYSEHDLRQMWGARSAENWDDLKSHEQLAFAQAQAIEADRRRAEPIAWCRSDDFADAAKKRQSFSGWREQHSDCDMALYGVPVPAFTMPATAPEDLAQQLNDYATHLRRMEEIGAIAEGGVAEMLAAVIFLLQQHDIDLTTAREALRRLVDWGGFQAWHDAATGFDAETVTAVLDWFANGMTGPLPPLPPDIASHEAVTEPAPSAPALPQAIVYEAGGGVLISATNSREESGWYVWRKDYPLPQHLGSDGQWCTQPLSPEERERDPDFLIRTRWPSAAAAWDALQRSRAAEGVEG